MKTYEDHKEYKNVKMKLIKDMWGTKALMKFQMRMNKVIFVSKFIILIERSFVRKTNKTPKNDKWELL